VILWVCPFVREFLAVEALDFSSPSTVADKPEEAGLRCTAAPQGCALAREAEGV